MIAEKILKGKLVSIRQISLDDCTNDYVDWLNDSDVNQFLETRWYKQDILAIKEFVKSQIENDNSILFAIIYNPENRHIGNIKIGPINFHHNHTDISYFIGDKNLWGLGIAVEAIQLACQYAFEELNLHRVEAGVYCNAIGSWKALEKNGFKREAIFREQVLFENNYIDVYRYGILKNEFNWRVTK